MAFNFLVKNENGVRTFLAVRGGFIITSPFQVMIEERDLSFVLDQITITELIEAEDGSMVIRHNIRSLAGISADKPSAAFTISLVEFDFDDGLATVWTKSYQVTNSSVTIETV